MQTILFVLTTGAEAGFEIRDVENLREHYVATLQDWVRKLDSNHDRVRALVGEPRYRIFRLYMSGATMGFRKGVYNLTQSLFAKLDGYRANVPPTRADLYV
jgi:cyclopropane-fatty-acyl-phospholipid synthase